MTKNHSAWPASRQSKNPSPAGHLGDWPINHLKWLALHMGLLHLMHKISTSIVDTKTCKPNPEMGSWNYKFINPGSRDWESNPAIAITSFR